MVGQHRIYAMHRVYHRDPLKVLTKFGGSIFIPVWDHVPKNSCYLLSKVRVFFFFVATFLLYIKTLFAATVPVCLYSKSERFSQRNLHDVFITSTQLRFVQRNFGTFQLYTKTLFAVTVPVCLYCKPARFLQRNLHYVFILHNNALCSEILVHFNCTPIRFLQRHLLCYSSTQKRFVQRNVCSFVLYTNTLFAANFLV